MEYVLVAVFIAGAMGLAFAAHQNSRRKIAQALEAQAAKRGGRVVPGTWLYLPQCVLDHEGTELHVSVMPGSASSGDDRPTTSACAYVATPNELRFHIRGPSLSTKLGGMLRFRSFETGNPAFDRRFVVDCTDERFVWELLSDRVIHKLLEFGAQDGLQVALRPAAQQLNGRTLPGEIRPRLMVSIQRIATEDVDYDRLLDSLTLLLAGLPTAVRRSQAAGSGGTLFAAVGRP